MLQLKIKKPAWTSRTGIVPAAQKYEINESDILKSMSYFKFLKIWGLFY
jgi:hypothetical protein